jgi:hypothetical protein
MDLLSGLTSAIFVAVLVLAGVKGASASIVLYETSFNNPPFVAASYWAGVDGWYASDPGNGSAAVASDGGAVYLGYTPPAGSVSFVERSFMFDPVARGLPIVKINTQMAIVDSTNSRFDAFGLVLYNAAGELLGVILFNNADFSLAYNDGGNVDHVLPGHFSAGVYFRITWTIDFSTNLASAIATNPDGSTFSLFSNRTFNATGRSLNLGAFDFGWIVNSTGTAGNNYLVADSFSVEAFPAPTLSGGRWQQHRTRKSSYTLRGAQAADDNVRVQVRAPGKRRWAVARASSTGWSFRVRKLVPGKNFVKVRLLNAVGAVIDQRKVVILRK